MYAMPGLACLNTHFFNEGFVMFVFNFILILLAAALLSNLINHFLPSLSVPLVQLLLGVLITLIPFGAFGVEFNLEPDLFFVLFLSPLVFHSTMTADKKTMQKMISPILMAAVGLVFLTIFTTGFVTFLIIPAVPLAVAFALAAALGPTDVVAVEAVAKRTTLPYKIISILTGESIINDATGIVCFQFAVLAVATGSFNLLRGLGRFLSLAIGGVTIGIIITLLKSLLVRWLRSLDMKSASLHIALGVMTPFIIYMTAEWLGVSGILAVFASGVIHSLYRDKISPETVNLNNAQHSVWEFLSFSLDGLVFIILGTQLPHIIDVDISGLHANGIWHIVGSIFAITSVLLVTRFIWWAVTVRRRTYDDPGHPMGKIRSGLIFSIAGARGTVPLASVLSIPLLLPDGTLFPERDMVILIASGVIVLSLLLTNFILPLLVRGTKESPQKKADQSAYVEILHTVVGRLKNEVTPETLAATEIVMRNYYARINHYHSDGRKAQGFHEKRKLKHDILLWEKDMVLRMAEAGQISEKAADHYIETTEHLMAEIANEPGLWRTVMRMIRHFMDTLTWRGTETDTKDVPKLTTSVYQNGSIIREEHLAGSINAIAINGFHMERVLIQQMLDANRISFRSAKELQADIAMLEAQLLAE